MESIDAIAPGDLIQIAPSGDDIPPMFRGTIAFVSEIKHWGVHAYALVPHEIGHPPYKFLGASKLISLPTLARRPG